MRFIPIATIQILLPAFNFNSQSLKLSDECGPIILGPYETALSQ